MLLVDYYVFQKIEFLCEEFVKLKCATKIIYSKIFKTKNYKQVIKVLLLQIIKIIYTYYSISVFNIKKFYLTLDLQTNEL